MVLGYEHRSSKHLLMPFSPTNAIDWPETHPIVKWISQFNYKITIGNFFSTAGVVRKFTQINSKIGQEAEVENFIRSLSHDCVDRDNT